MTTDSGRTDSLRVQVPEGWAMSYRTAPAGTDPQGESAVRVEMVVWQAVGHREWTAEIPLRLSAVQRLAAWARNVFGPWSATR